MPIAFVWFPANPPFAMGEHSFSLPVTGWFALPSPSVGVEPCPHLSLSLSNASAP